jgi:hypothetical protein
MIHYNPTFQQKVQGKLLARFQLDDNGGPEFGVEDETKYYYIDLSVRSPQADKIQKVTYFLDEATYWEPERETRDRKNDFTEEITSYGDYKVRVAVDMAAGSFVQQALLSDMLEEGHQGDSGPEIQKAIEYIRQN